jgi:hypothetical protein
MSAPRLLPLLAVATLLALLLAAALLAARQGTPALAAHIGFAMGVMPLILAAMSYFVPVLTRGEGAGAAAWLPPLLALAGGILLVVALATDYSNFFISLAALLALGAALGLAAWAMHRTRRMVGRRHPGIDWYFAALGLLLLALCAVLAMPWFPDQRAQLRLFHLHANLLGFVGLTALGTLQVLLPTCLGLTDPAAARRLRRDLKWAVAGSLLIAIGASSLLPAALAAAATPLAAVGGLLYIAVVLRMLIEWVMRFRGALLAPHSAAASLLAAALGLGCLLLLSLPHGLGYLSGRAAVAGFVIAFLLPLVSGAAAQLLPIWLRPGVQGPWHVQLRRRLSRWSALRGFALLLAGLVLTVV